VREVAAIAVKCRGLSTALRFGRDDVSFRARWIGHPGQIDRGGRVTPSASLRDGE
jgi:hypothetical protein